MTNTTDQMPNPDDFAAWLNQQPETISMLEQQAIADQINAALRAGHWLPGIDPDKPHIVSPDCWCSPTWDEEDEDRPFWEHHAPKFKGEAPAWAISDGRDIDGTTPTGKPMAIWRSGELFDHSDVSGEVVREDVYDQHTDTTTEGPVVLRVWAGEPLDIVSVSEAQGIAYDILHASEHLAQALGNYDAPVSEPWEQAERIARETPCPYEACDGSYHAAAEDPADWLHTVAQDEFEGFTATITYDPQDTPAHRANIYANVDDDIDTATIRQRADTYAALPAWLAGVALHVDALNGVDTLAARFSGGTNAQ